MGAPSDLREQEWNETMPDITSLPLQPMKIGGAQIHFQNVQLRDDVLVDEVHLDGGGITLEPPTATSVAEYEPGRSASGPLSRSRMSIECWRITFPKIRPFAT